MLDFYSFHAIVMALLAVIFYIPVSLTAVSMTGFKDGDIRIRKTVLTPLMILAGYFIGVVIIFTTITVEPMVSKSLSVGISAITYFLVPSTMAYLLGIHYAWHIRATTVFAASLNLVIALTISYIWWSAVNY